MRGSFFKTLLWIIKQEKQKPEIPKFFGFMANRWLSMATKSNAQIVNLTTNRWNYHSIFEEETLAKFYHAVIPKHFKKIEYIKKIKINNIIIKKFPDEQLELGKITVVNKLCSYTDVKIINV